MDGINTGRLRIDPVVEIEHKMMPKEFLFSDLSFEEAHANSYWLDSRHICQDTLSLGMSFRSYLVRVHGLNILVDTCNGNHKQRPSAPWQHDLRAQTFMENLHKLGMKAEDIHIVICTHLHGDHVGWNTRLEHGKWVPTFPNARYLMSAKEFAALQAQFDAADPFALNRGAFADSILPVFEANLVDLVEPDMTITQEIEERVVLMPTPGHTIGHMCVCVSSPQCNAVIAGDALHHAIQLDLPDMVMRADADPERARLSRRMLLEHCVDQNSWLCANHIPVSAMNQVCAYGDRFRFRGWV